MGRRRTPGFCWLAAGALFLAAGGCEAPPAVTTNAVLEPQEQDQKRILSSADQAEVLAALRSIAEGKRPAQRPAPAPGGKRWSDVKAAVSAALADIEATVVRTIESEEGDRYRFVIQTIEDYPGELAVWRADAPRVYEAQAWIGRFPTEPRHVERAEALLKALEKHMKRLGKLPRFDQ